jgi:hypothetical protein
VPLTAEQREAVEKTIADLKRMEEQTGKLVGSWTPRLRAPVEEYLRVLDPGNDRYGRCVLTADEIDDLIRNALLLNQSGEYDPLIIAACAAYSRCDRGDYRHWSHAVCHNFERYDPASPQDSLLGHPALAPAVEHLLEESVNRLIEGKKEGSFGRTVKGVIKYALGHVDPAHIDEPFPSKPQCLSDERLVAVLSPHSIEGIFCRAETPREFIEGVAALKAASPDKIYPPWIPLDLFAAVRTEANQEVVDAAFSRLVRDSFSQSGDAAPLAPVTPSSVTELRVQRDEAQKTTTVTPGVFIDVEGTLIVKSQDRAKGWKLTWIGNQVAMLSPGSRVPITIFTGGDPVKTTEVLQSLGFPSELLPVRSKQDFAGHHLEMLIDDTPPDVQGFAAKEVIKPRWEFDFETRKLDDRLMRLEWMRLDPLRAMARYNAEVVASPPTEVPESAPPVTEQEPTPPPPPAPTQEVVEKRGWFSSIVESSKARIDAALRLFRGS